MQQEKSHFFAFLSRMKFIRRWGLMHAHYPENVQEHSQRVALIAHALVLIGNRHFDGSLDADKIAVLALFHDATEVLTGDLPTPVKYHNPELADAYKQIETSAADSLLQMVPADLRADYEPLLLQKTNAEYQKRIKAADRLCALIKCQEESRAGNQEFKQAERTLRKALRDTRLPEVEYFMTTFLPSFSLPLDELQTK